MIPKQIINPRQETINGVTVTLGICPVCGRNLRRSCLNSVGPRCHYEGTQFDRSGTEIWNLLTRPAEIRGRRIKAREVYALYPTQPVRIFASIDTEPEPPPFTASEFRDRIAALVAGKNPATALPPIKPHGCAFVYPRNNPRTATPRKQT